MANADEVQRRLDRLREATAVLSPPPGLAERIAAAAAGRELTVSFFLARWSRAAVGGAVALAACAMLLAIGAERAWGEVVELSLPAMLEELP